MDINVRLTTGSPHNVTAVQVETAVGSKTSDNPSTLKTENAKPKAAEVEQAVKDIQSFIDSIERNLRFSIDEESGEVVVKVVAKASGELIRQMPSEEALELARSLKEDSENRLLQAKV